MKRLIKNNKGVSLVELIVVLAIMVVLGAAGTITYGLVSTKSATQCAENIKIGLEKHKTSVMGKKNGRVVFYKDSDGAIWMYEDFDYKADEGLTIDSSKAVKIGKRDVSITFDGAELTTTPEVIVFSRSGALGSGNLPIVIKRGNKTYKIEIEPLTGKIKMS